MELGNDEEAGSKNNHQQHQCRKRYHRHMTRQIQALERTDLSPNEKQRTDLSRDLRLEVQHEGQDNRFLHVENHKIRCQNIALRKALKNIIFPNCGGPPIVEDDFDEQKLRMEKARLKDELDRVPGLIYKFLGRPFMQAP